MNLHVLNSILRGIVAFLNRTSTEDAIGVACESTVWLLLWQIIQVIQQRWPRLDISDLNKAIQTRPDLRDLVHSIKSGTLEDFFEKRGGFYNRVGMMLWHPRVLLVLKKDKEDHLWFTSRWKHVSGNHTWGKVKAYSGSESPEATLVDAGGTDTYREIFGEHCPWY